MATPEGTTGEDARFTVVLGSEFGVRSFGFGVLPNSA
jgi:hypothetical protein